MATDSKQAFRRLRLRLRVEEVTPEIQVSERFSKRSLRGVVDGEYPQHYEVQFTGKKMNEIDNAMEGTFVTVIAFVNGRKIEKEGKGMYFTSIDFHEFENE
jgi:hypothetical protein